MHTAVSPWGLLETGVSCYVPDCSSEGSRATSVLLDNQGKRRKPAGQRAERGSGLFPGPATWLSVLWCYLTGLMEVNMPSVCMFV